MKLLCFEKENISKIIISHQDHAVVLYFTLEKNKKLRMLETPYQVLQQR